MSENPVIAAIDAGHVMTALADDRVCTLDRQPWPCMDIRAARLLASDRARAEAQRKAIAAGRLSVR